MPAVSAMLLACGCHVLITCTALLLERSLQAQSKLRSTIKAVAAAGTMLIIVMVSTCFKLMPCGAALMPC